MQTLPSESKRIKSGRRRHRRDIHGRREPRVKLDGRIKFLLALVSAILAALVFSHFHSL